MNQDFILHSKELFPGSEILSRHAFNAMNTRDESALLARANRQLSRGFDISRDKSAHFQKKDCFECLSPHEIAA